MGCFGNECKRCPEVDLYSQAVIDKGLMKRFGYLHPSGCGLESDRWPYKTKKSAEENADSDTKKNKKNFAHLANFAVNSTCCGNDKCCFCNRC